MKKYSESLSIDEVGNEIPLENNRILNDDQFLLFRNTLTQLYGLGAICVIFPKKEENNITTAIWKRFHYHGAKTLYLSDIKIIFI